MPESRCQIFLSLPLKSKMLLPAWKHRERLQQPEAIHGAESQRPLHLQMDRRLAIRRNVIQRCSKGLQRARIHRRLVDAYNEA